MSKIQEDLRKWFKEKWVRFDTEGNIKGECARGEGEGKPKCLPMAKAQALGKEARASAAKRKRREDPKPHRKGKAKFVSTESFDPEELEKARKMLTGEQGKGNVGGNLKAKDFIKIHNAMHKIKPANTNTKGPFNPDVKEEYLEEKNKPTNPKLWSQAISMVKKKFKIYPSAYANAAAAKWYKSKGGGWKTMKEESQTRTKILFMESLGYEVAEAKVEQDHEKEMARTQLKTAMDAIQRLMKKIGSGEGQLEAWVQSKLTKAVDYIDSVADYMDNNDKIVKEAIELADVAREYIDETYYDKLTRRGDLVGHAATIAKRTLENRGIKNPSSKFNANFHDKVLEILKTHGVTNIHNPEARDSIIRGNIEVGDAIHKAFQDHVSAEEPAETAERKISGASQKAQKSRRPRSDVIRKVLRTEEYGAGDMGTCELTDKYKDETPGQSVKKKRKKK